MSRPLIPKEPIVPDLSLRQIEELTNIIFLPEIPPSSCDAVFVFAGTHPGHWEKAIEAFQSGYGKKMIVTGGVSPAEIKHPQWRDANTPEADIIVEKLMENGVKAEDIVFENQSRNTLENVLFAKKIFDFSTLDSLLFVCKNHAAGRQYRTLAQQISHPVRYVPFGFDAVFGGEVISREEWMNSEVGRARVFGEYLRILQFGKMGHVLPLEREIEGLEKYVRKNFEVL